MKRFVKISLGLAITFAVIGIISLVSAFAMGLSWKQLDEMAENGELAITKDELTGKVPFLSISKEQANYNYPICDDLDIDCEAGAITISYGDVDQIEVYQAGMKNFHCEMDENTLEIHSGKADGNITVTIPEGHTFNEVDLEVGAGQANIDDLCAREFDIEVGAGQANLNNIDIKNLNAKTGAGQIQAELVESEEDYNCKVDCGIGEIQIGESFFSGLGKDTHIKKENATRKLDISCGVGQIIIEFQE